MTNIVGLLGALQIRGGMKNFHEVLYSCLKELFGLTQDAFNARWRLKDELDSSTLRKYTQPTAEALFEEWKLRRDPSWLYSHPEYKWDSLGVSTFQTTGTTTGGVKLLKNANVTPRKIFDWGAGPGFSTMIMACNFPSADIHYNELNPELVRIFEWFCDRAKIKNIRHVSQPENDYDVIQAYEIVEHISHESKPGVGDPITETLKILENVNVKPAFFLHSSCWTAEKRYFTLGHFLHYDIDGQVVNNNRAGRYFKNALSKRGWNIIDSGWNSRPFLFSKDSLKTYNY
jgi:hypothetical protein